VQFFPLLLPLLLLLPKVLFSSFESIESIFVSKKSLVFISAEVIIKWLENSRDCTILRLIKKTEEHKLIILTVITVIV